MTLTLILTATLILLAAGFLILLDRKDARAHTRQQSHDEQVERLCQRIRAPELAVVRHDVEQAQDESTGAPPVMDEEVWEQSEQAEWVRRIEDLENAPFERAS